MQCKSLQWTGQQVYISAIQKHLLVTQCHMYVSSNQDNISGKKTTCTVKFIASGPNYLLRCRIINAVTLY